MKVSDAPSFSETWGSYLTRQSVRVIGLLGVVALFGASAAMNLRFGLSLGTTPLDQALYGAASVAADVVKALLPLLAIALWRARRRGLALAAAGVWTLALAWSVASAIGFASATRDAAAAGRADQIAARAALEARIARLEARLDAQPARRAPEAVAAEIDAAAVPRAVWRRTAGCTDVTRADSMAACRPVLELRRELAAAQDAAALETALAKAQAARAAAARAAAEAGVGASADPQAEALAELLALETGEVKRALALLVTALIELGAAFGFTIVGVGATVMARETRPPGPASSETAAPYAASPPSASPRTSAPAPGSRIADAAAPAARAPRPRPSARRPSFARDDAEDAEQTAPDPPALAPPPEDADFRQDEPDEAALHNQLPPEEIAERRRRRRE